MLFELLIWVRVVRVNLLVCIYWLVEMVEVCILILDCFGVVVEVFMLVVELGVNLFDFEVLYLVEGDKGILIVFVVVGDRELFRGGLLVCGFWFSIWVLD